MKKLILDTETRSNKDLRNCGVYVYSEVPVSGDEDGYELLLVSYKLDEEVKVFSPLEGAWPEEFTNALLDPTYVKIAHNAQFDRVVLSRAFYDAPDTFLDPAHWQDTMARAAYNGMPKGLDKLSAHLGIGRKLSEGKYLIMYFNQKKHRDTLVKMLSMKPQKLRKLDNERATLTEVAEAKGRLAKADRDRLNHLTYCFEVLRHWDTYKSYCRLDTELLAEVDAQLDPLPADEQATWVLDQKINDTGVLIDLDLAKAAEGRMADITAQAKAKMKELTGVDNPGSVVQMKAWLKGHGIETPSLDKAHVRMILDKEETPGVVRDALRLRELTAASSVAKFTAMESRCSIDGIARGCFAYYGAHTGRWAGRGIQLQNLPRVKGEEVERISALAEDLAAVSTASVPDLKKLIRPCIFTPEGSVLHIADFAAIEARVLAWLADEAWALHAFAANQDIYKATYAAMEGIKVEEVGEDERQRGKTASLALGYGGGTAALRRMGGENLTIPKAIEREHARLVKQMAEADGEAPPELREFYLLRLRDQWRKQNLNIVGLWARLTTAFREAAFRNAKQKVGKLRIEPFAFTRDDKTTRNNVKITLPSGREMFYWNVHERRVQTEDDWERKELVFTEGTGMVTYTWGGKLTENVVQAIARDLLRDAMLRIDAMGLRIVAHIHDEVVVEVDEDDDLDLLEVMRFCPDWAEGLPLNAEVAVSTRYLGHAPVAEEEETETE